MSASQSGDAPAPRRRSDAEQNRRRLLDAVAALLGAHPPVRALQLWLDELAIFGHKKHAGRVRENISPDGLLPLVSFLWQRTPRATAPELASERKLSIVFPHGRNRSSLRG
jgi:hypothetical protein